MNIFLLLYYQMIEFYEKKDPYFELSNYYERAPFRYQGLEFASSEHFYHWSKFFYASASSSTLAYAEIVRQASTPNKARVLGQLKTQGGYATAWYLNTKDRRSLNELIREALAHKVSMREDWDEVKDNVMRKALWQKFSQNTRIQELLMQTGSALLVEASPRDAYWGFGPDRQGLNMLGFLLMEIRTFLLGQYPPAPLTIANWVIPYYLIASAYPEVESHQEIVSRIVYSRIDIIISLPEKAEQQRLMYYLPYLFNQVSDTIITQPEKITGRLMTYYNVPIPNRENLTDEQLQTVAEVIAANIGKKFTILVHCIEGQPVIGMVLGLIYGMKAQEVFQVIAASYATRLHKGNLQPHSMPQNHSQLTRLLG